SLLASDDRGTQRDLRQWPASWRQTGSTVRRRPRLFRPGRDGVSLSLTSLNSLHVAPPNRVSPTEASSPREGPTAYLPLIGMAAEWGRRARMKGGSSRSDAHGSQQLLRIVRLQETDFIRKENENENPAVHQEEPRHV